MVAAQLELGNTGESPSTGSNKRSTKGLTRVKVACALCSSAKVRCDQNRPCSRCHARGTSDQCVDRIITPHASRALHKQLKEVKACNPCYLAKVACSDARPCPRCIRLHQPNRCVILSRRNSNQQGQLDPQHSRRMASVSMAMSPFAQPVIVPATLRSLFKNAVFIRYTPSEIASFVRNPAKMDILLQTLSSTLSLNDRMELRQSLTTISYGKDVKESRDGHNFKLDPSRKSSQLMSPFSLTPDPNSTTFPDIDFESRTEATIRFVVDVLNPKSLQESFQMSKAAEALLGYSALQLSRGFEMQPAPDSRATVMFVNPYWKLFHPSSWEVLACNYLDCVIREITSAHFPVRLMRRDGQTVDVLSSWQAVPTEAGSHIITVVFSPLVPDQYIPPPSVLEAFYVSADSIIVSTVSDNFSGIEFEARSCQTV